MELKKNLKVRAIVGCSMLGVCSSVFSADEPTKGRNSEVIQTIVVTAERQSQSVQKVPASIQAFTAEDLASSGVTSIDDLQHISPGVVMSDNASLGHIYMRGIGGDIQGAGIESGVAVYVDGVYQSRPSSTVFQFVDVERIEVMKGPQGVLYGRNATGGAINIITAAPSKVSEGQFDAQLGRFDERILRGTFSGPLSDGVAYGRLSLLSKKNDGFVKNLLLDNRNSSESESVRGTVEFKPSTSLNIRINAHYYKNDSIPLVKALYPAINPVFSMGAKVISDPYEVSSDGPGSQQDKHSGLDMTVKYDLDWARLTSITAINKEKWLTANFENDGTEVPLAISGSPTPMVDDTKFISQDFTLVSTQAGPIQWTALASYMHQTIDSRFPFSMPAFGFTMLSTGKITTDSSGIGGQASYAFDHGLKLTAGARYSSDTKKIDAINEIMGGVVATQNEQKTWSAWSPKIVAEYSPSKDVMYFSSITKGFKGGGYDNITISKPINPEYVTNYEAGVKSTQLNGRLRFNASVFSMKYTDMQLAVIETNPSGAVVNTTKNAAKATINGLEIGVVAKPIPRLELSGNLQLLRARFDEFLTGDQLRPALGMMNLKDNTLPYAPNTTLNVAAQYSWPNAMERTDMILHVDASSRSRMYYDVYQNDLASDPSLTLWNASLRFEPSSDKGIYGAAFVKNITDKHYTNYVLGTTLGYHSIVAQPRTFGILVGYRY